MSAKNVDRHNRFRSITVGFRVSPEEQEELNRAVALSGLPKQEYCYRKCMGREVVVQPNPRVHKALKTQMTAILAELERIAAGDSVPDELLSTIDLIAVNDYDIVGRMKQFADKNGVCLLLVHHTRKQQAGDKFEMISGTTGLLGCADGAFLLQKEKRTDLNATLEIVGRDQPDQKLHLTRDAEKLTWQLDHVETELWKKPPDPLLSKLAAVIAGDTPVWNGSATELVALLGEDMQPNILTRRLNVKAGELLNEHGIEYTVKRTRSGSFISLARKAV